MTRQRSDEEKNLPQTRQGNDEGHPGVILPWRDDALITSSLVNGERPRYFSLATA